MRPSRCCVTFNRALCAGLFLCALATSAWPQNFPQKAIRIIVPTVPGGATDLTARLVAQKMAERFGQAVVVENRPGGNEVIGTDVVAKSVADGYTLLVAAPAAIVVLPHLQTLPYNVDKDLSPISLAAVTPLILVVPPSLSAQTVNELIALAKAKPGQLAYASTGSGGVQHLAAELLKISAKIDLVHVPYKGAGQVMQDLLGGQVAIFFSGMPPAMAHVRSGKLRALAVTSAHRSASAPDVPTMAEAGVPGFDINNWFAFFAPAGTPADVIGKLNTEINHALKQADVREKLASAGAEAAGGSAEDLAKFLRGESAKFASLIKLSGAKLSD